MKFLKYLIFYSLITNITINATQTLEWLKTSKTGFAGFGKSFQGNITIRDIGSEPFILTTIGTALAVYYFLSNTKGYQKELFNINRFANSNIPEIQQIYQEYDNQIHQLYNKNKPACFVKNIQALVGINKDKAEHCYRKLDMKAQELETNLYNEAMRKSKPHYLKANLHFYTKNVIKTALISIPITYAAVWSLDSIFNKKIT